MKVFVYGTLKRNGRLNGALSNSKFLGEAVTKEKYRMTNCGYPFLIDEGARDYPAKGELWEINEETLRRLDGIEGEGHLYNRKTITVKDISNGTEKETYVYIACKGRGDGYPKCNVVEDDTIGTYYWY